jgi:hypothetical protein
MMEMRLPYPVMHLKEVMTGFLKGRPDRKKAYLYAIYAIIPLALLAGGLTLYGSYASVRKAVEAKKKEIGVMATLKADYIGKKTALDTLSQRAAESGESPVSAIEEIAKRTGIKERVASVKPLEERPSPGYIDKPAEVRLEAVDLNQLVNFLYHAESGGKLMVVRELSMKSRFEDPDLLDVTMEVSLVTRGM